MPNSNLKIQNCTFTFQCDEDWNKMNVDEKFESEKVRFCNKCEKSVFLSLSDKELEENARLNRCVAVIDWEKSPEKPLHETEPYRVRLGVPDYASLMEADKFDSMTIEDLQSEDVSATFRMSSTRLVFLVLCTTIPIGALIFLT